MNDWQEYLLEEITEPIKDTYNPTKSTNYTYIGLEHIKPETLRLSSVGCSDDVTSNKFKFKENDILFGKLRPYFRKVIKPSFSGICSTDIWVFRAKNGFSQNFLYYFLANWDFVDTANSGESGTRMPRADWNFLRWTKWLLPPSTVQDIITEVLSSFDDKIDLLTRQNASLEALAQTYFRQWFLEDSNNHENTTVSQIADIANNSINPAKQPLEPFHHYSIPAFDNAQTPIIELGKNILSNKFIVLPNTVLISKLNPDTPRIWLIGEKVMPNSICSTEFQVLVPNERKYHYFIYCLMKSYTVVQEFAQSATGTSGSHQRIRPEQILQVEIAAPDSDLLTDFNELCHPMFIKIETNKQQIQTLQKLRDTLLPKLISGEVRVKQ